jgi:ankyrin repeat protein
MLSNPSLDIDKSDKNGVNAFFMAAYHGHIPIMRRLMEKGINMFKKNSNGSNVLHIAVKREQMEVLNELIRIKYPLDEPKVNGITACGIAAMRGSVKFLERLYESDADMNLTSPAGIGPLYLAIKARQIEASSFLIEAGVQLYINDPVKVDYSPIFIAIRTSQIPIIEMMVDQCGGSLDEFRDSQGYSPFMLAVKLGLHDVLNYLSLRGVDLNQEDPQRRTVLMHFLLYEEEQLKDPKSKAQMTKLLDLTRKLIARGANVNFTSSSSEYGQTLLIQAIRKHKKHAIEFLLDHGANPHIEDLSGNDACDHAQKHGLAAHYEELANCNKKLRVPSDSQNVAQQSPAFNPSKSATPTRKGMKYRDKYDQAYKQLSNDLGQGTREKNPLQANSRAAQPNDDQVNMDNSLDGP